MNIQISGFKNPPSTTTFSNVLVNIKDSACSAVLATATVSLAGFTPDTLTVVPTIKPIGTGVIGDTAQKIEVSFTTKNTLPINSRIYLVFPAYFVGAVGKYYVQSQSPNCFDTTSGSTVLQCTFVQSNNTLSIQVGNTAIKSAPTTIKFQVDNIMNPYSGAPRYGFSLITLDVYCGQIDSYSSTSGTFGFTVSSFTTFQNPVIARGDANTAVGASSILMPIFQLNLPIDPNCRLQIVFPTDLPLTNTISATGQGLFATITSTKQTTYTITMDGCSFSSTKDPSDIGIVNLNSVTNKGYVQSTGYFTMTLYAFDGGNQYNIAQSTGVLQLTDFTPASMKSLAVVPYSDYYVQDNTQYKVTFNPSQNIPNSAKIQITFPTGNDFVLITGSCTLISTLNILTTATCSVASNVITITSPFGPSPNSFSTSQGSLSFIFYATSSTTSMAGTNPSSAAPIGQWTISTYYIDTSTSTPYLIEQSSFSDLFTAIPSALQAGVATDNYVSCRANSVYTITFTPKKVIPNQGKVQIIFPSQISLTGAGLTKCQAVYSDTTTQDLVCSIDTTNIPLSVTIPSVFTTTSAYSGAIQIVMGGITNPSTLAPTTSFTVNLLDATVVGYQIETVSTLVTVQMKTPSSIVQSGFSVVMANTTNGASTTYTIRVTSPCYLLSGSFLTVTFPPEITVLSSPTCTAISPLTGVTCSSNGNTGTFKLTFSGGSLSANNGFSLTMKSIKNPSSTKSTSSFPKVQLSDGSGLQIASYSGTYTTSTNTAAQGQSPSLTQAEVTLNQTTIYTLTYTSSNVMNSGTTFLITYPVEIIPSSTLTSCQMFCGGIQYVMSCTLNEYKYQIIMSSLNGQCAAGQKIQVQLGPIRNPATNLYNISTMTVTAYTDTNLQYAIDTVTDFLNPQLDCIYPCKTCNKTSQKTCLSCFPTDINNFVYYYNYYCYKQCPDGYYADSNKLCQKCDSHCKTCTNSATYCLTCNTGSSYPEFYNNFCYAKCPSGTFSSNNICLKCNSVCATCEGSSSQCTSCNKAIASQAYLNDGACLSGCPDETVPVSYVCKSCNSPCLNCIIDQVTCTACLTGYLYGFNCLSSCPNGTVQSGQKCIGCDPNCMSCASSNSGLCTQCTSAYILYNNVCYKACPSGYEPDSQNIQCQQIQTPIIISNGTGNGTGVKTSDKIYAYFPVTITQTVFGGISAASYLKEAASLPLSNCLGFWGPLELISMGGQTYLSYQKQIENANSVSVDDTTNSTNNSSNSSSSNSSSEASGRRRRNLASSSTSSVYPLVFYGTAASFLIKIFTNIAFGIIHICLLRRDKGYREHRSRFNCTERFILGLGLFFSFKLYKFTYSFLFGYDRFSVPYQEPQRIHNIMNILTIVNMVLTLLPVMFVDVYGLIKYGWGDQFYVMIIETLILCFSTIIVTVLEFRSNRVKSPYPEGSAYSGLQDMTDEALLDELKKRMGDDFWKLMNQDKPSGLKGKRRCNSMPDLGRELEEDERRVHTDPLDPEERKRYESQPNPFQRNNYPDNVIAEPYKTKRPKMDPSKLKLIATQTGEYDPDNQRKGRKIYEKEINESMEFDRRKGKNAKMRGRKDKYYEQVDAEDKTFADDTMGNLVDDEKSVKSKLGKIDEESLNTDEESQKKKTLLAEKGKKLASPSKQSPIKIENQKPTEQPASVKKQDTKKSLKSEKKQDSSSKKEKVVEEKVSPKTNKGQKMEVQKSKEKLRTSKEEQKFLEDTILQQQKQSEILSQTQREMENQILQQVKEEEGVVDSDEDDEQRLKNMVDPNKRKFNVNDILGELDRDDKGNLVMLQNKEGLNVDKKGNRVNDKGYLIDAKTGDVLEKEKRKKVFDKKDLSEKGEIPPPFNIEKYNFNPHDVRGHFDRDQYGNEIIGNKKNQKGQLVDKLGRVVNQYGYLIDEKGNLVDKRGRVRLHVKQMEDGNLPLLFNYKGKKFDIKDVIGDFDKDRKGNIIIRRDKDNNMVDKKGRRVNRKGYLVDEQGNVINKDGKIIFNENTLSQDQEIPKLFPFLKFNIDEIKGDFEMDPLGNPMLSRNNSGQLIDHKGRIVNEKGYLVDNNGNIQNGRGQKVFGRTLIQQDGEIPKVFRTGLFRKDSLDSFIEFINDIEELEKQQEIASEKMKMKGGDHRRQLSKDEMDENERIAKKIDQIMEEDNDDDDMLMKELEELAHGKKKKKKGRDMEGDEESLGGNTSFESLMEDTPSNYNVANQRFLEQEQMKERAKQGQRSANIIKENMEGSDSNDEDGEEIKMKKKRRKKRKKKAAKQENQDPVERELLMAKAYGAMSSTQVDKLIQDKRRKEALIAAQLQKQNMFKNQSISRVQSNHSKRKPLRNTNSTHRLGLGEPSDIVKKNGYMQNTVQNFNHDGFSQGSKSGTAKLDTARKLNQVATEQNFNKKKGQTEKKRDYNLTHITNSVSGFYKGGDSASETSKINRSIHGESNYAQNIPLKRQLQNEENKERELMQGKDPLNDAELDRIYKTAKQFADISMLSDWEKDSLLSGDSGFSQYTGILNNPATTTKVRGLESIYLQRLEPPKGKIPPGARKKGRTEEKAKFRVMHHRLHDEPEWYVEEGKDQNASIISDQKKYLEKKFREEFISGNSGSGKKKQPDHGPNIFHGNLNQYKEKQYKRNQSIVELEK